MGQWYIGKSEQHLNYRKNEFKNKINKFIKQGKITEEVGAELQAWGEKFVEDVYNQGRSDKEHDAWM